MHWTESTVIDRPLEQVHAAIADEHRLMAWSAWPEATGYVCAVDGDGRSVGSAIVFRDRAGVEQGRQRLARVETDLIEYRLRNRGPGGREITPAIDFRLEPLGSARTRVHLDFRATAPLPPGIRHVAEFFLGRRVRRLHITDLEQLKVHVEATPAPSARSTACPAAVRNACVGETSRDRRVPDVRGAGGCSFSSRSRTMDARPPPEEEP